MKALALAVAFAACLCLPANAQQYFCGPSREFMRVIFQTFGERPFVRGVNEQKTHVFELVVNPATRTWSMVIHHGNTTCLVANGEDFGRSADVPAEDEIPIHYSPLGRP